MDFPVLWGFLAFLLNYVPSVGSTIAAVPAVLLAFVQLGTARALLAAAGYMAVNFLLDNVIEMKLMGRRLHLSTLVVFLSLMFWGSLLGPVGHGPVHPAHHDPEVRLREQRGHALDRGAARAGGRRRGRSADVDLMARPSQDGR